MSLRLKKEFKKKYEAILGSEAEELFKYLSKPLKRSIRINTLKGEDKNIAERLKDKYGWRLEEVPWHPWSYWIVVKDRPLGKTLEHQLGYYYVQEAASLVPVLALNPKPGERVLDLCASPGSKTTQMAQAMNNKGIIVANDVEIERISILAYNVQRCGASNCILTLEDGRSFEEKDQKFDKILVDAPCTGTGSIRKDSHIAEMWSQAGVEGLSRTQKQLIKSAFSCLRKGGILVYSTCSLAPEENEEVVDHLLGTKEARLVDFDIPDLKTRSGLDKFRNKDYNTTLKRSKRIWPQDNDTGGFFLAKIKK